MAAQQKSNKRSSRGMSPGRSMAQFGHVGHAGKSQSKAQKHQKAGINTPSRGPGSNPNMGQTPPKKTATVSTPKKTTFKDKLISGARTLGELKHIRDVLTGNWLGVGKNVLGTIGARKLLGDQAYRGGDIQSWDEDDVSGIGSFNFADMGITTPNTDYTQLAKVTDDQKAIIKRDIGLVPDLFSVQDVYDKAKKLDDTGAFWNPLDKGDPMTKPEFNEYIKTLPGREEKGPFINLKADGGLINFFKNGGFLG